MASHGTEVTYANEVGMEDCDRLWNMLICFEITDEQLQEQLYGAGWVLKVARHRLHEKEETISKLRVSLMKSTTTQNKAIAEHEKMANHILNLKLELEAKVQPKKSETPKQVESDERVTALETVVSNHQAALAASFQRCESAENALEQLGYERTSTGNWLPKRRTRKRGLN
jgi:hypothetical protein